MALQVDTTVDVGFGTSSSTQAWNHTVAATANLLVVTAQFAQNGGATAAISGITYNGVALTQAVHENGVAGTFCSDIWYLKNPSTGTHSISVTFNGTISSFANGSISFIGADSTTPIGATNHSGQSGSSYSLGITTTRTSSYLVDSLGIASFTGVFSPGGGQTAFQNDQNPSFGSSGSSYKSVGSVGSYTMQWTNDSSGSSVGSSVVEILAANQVSSSRNNSTELMMGI